MADDNIQICEADVGDVDILASIGFSSFRDAYQPYSDPADIEAHLSQYFTADVVRDEFERGQSRFLIAQVNDEAGGMVKFHNAACPEPGVGSNAIELQQLYVLAEMQRHGLGGRLVEKLIAIARKSEVTGIWLSAWEDADWAINFYRKAGFSAVGTAIFTVGAASYTDLLMWLPLGEARKTRSH